MVKDGFFCVYNNIEYEVTRNKEHEFIIMTEEINKVTPGFVDKYNSGVYTKPINKKDVSDYYRISSKAIYKGVEFNITTEKGSELFLGTDNAELARKMDFDRTDKYYYEKWVPENEVEIIMKRKELSLDN
ncbi:hypothetical protein [Listeria aquatica]|uniref:hypothetical protein n=1 Tax=Listeria aquatica TaxID=1494960 RepID=UPI0031F4CC2B